MRSTSTSYQQDSSAQRTEAAPDEAVPDHGSNAARAAELTTGANPAPSATPTLDAVSAASAASKAEALANHRSSVGRVRRLLDAALSSPIPDGEDDASRLVLLRNSAEWLDSGAIGTQVLDKTHDSAQRAPAGQVAFFDTRVAWDSGAADYDETSLTNNAGIAITFDESGHFDPANDTMVFADATEQSESDLANTLVHELQHACDSGPGNGFERGIGATQPTGPYDAPVWVYRDFASEYRARVIDPVEAANRYGDPSKPASSPVTLVATRDPSDPDVVSGALTPTDRATTAFATEQQQAVWADMIRDSSPTVWFDWASGEWNYIYGYFAHHYVLDPRFRAYVDQLGAAGPVAGGNAVNSIRIDALADGIAAGKPAMVLMLLADDLDGVDLAFLQDPSRSTYFWTAAARALATRLSVYAKLQARVLGETTVDPGSDVYTVVKGDTLADIADRLLGSRARLTEILALNPAITDPDRIEVGDRITLPPA
ncbi:MAG: LysM domain-containing protein [Myxococcota bacterium]